MQDPGTISLYRSFLAGGGWAGDSGKRSRTGRLAGVDGSSGFDMEGLGVRDGRSGWVFGMGVRASSQGRDVWQGGRGRTSELGMETGTMGGRGKELRVCQDGRLLIQDGQRACQANICKSKT